MPGILSSLTDELNELNADIAFLDNWIQNTYTEKVIDIRNQLSKKYEGTFTNYYHCLIQVIQQIQGIYTGTNKPEMITGYITNFGKCIGKPYPTASSKLAPVLGDIKNEMLSLAEERQIKAKELDEKKKRAAEVKAEIAASTETETEYLATATEYVKEKTKASKLGIKLTIGKLSVWFTKYKSQIILGSVGVAAIGVIYFLFVRKK